MDAITDITLGCAMGMVKMAKKPHILSNLDYLNWQANIYKRQCKEYQPKIITQDNLQMKKNIRQFFINLLYSAMKNWTIQISM